MALKSYTKNVWQSHKDIVTNNCQPPYSVVTKQLQVERRTGKFADRKTGVLPLFHATN